MNNKNLYLQKFSNECLTIVNMKDHMNKFAFLSSVTGLNKSDIKKLREYGEIINETGITPNELKNIFNELKKSGIGLNEIREYVKEFQEIRKATKDIGGMKNVAKYLKDAGHMAKKYNKFKPYLPYIGGVGLGALGGGLFGGTNGAIFGGLGTGLLMYLLRNYIFKKNSTNTDITTDTKTDTTNKTKADTKTDTKGNTNNSKNISNGNSGVINEVPKDNNNSIVVDDSQDTANKNNDKLDKVTKDNNVTEVSPSSSKVNSKFNPVLKFDLKAPIYKGGVLDKLDKDIEDNKNKNYITIPVSQSTKDNNTNKKIASTESLDKAKFNPLNFEGPKYPKYSIDALRNVSDKNDDHKITFKQLVDTGKTNSNEKVNVYKHIRKPLADMFSEEQWKMYDKARSLNKNMKVLEYFESNKDGVNSFTDIHNDQLNRYEEELKSVNAAFDKLKNGEKNREYYKTLFDKEGLEKDISMVKSQLNEEDKDRKYNLERFKQITGKDWNSLDEETKNKLISNRLNYMRGYRDYLLSKAYDMGSAGDLISNINYKNLIKQISKTKNTDGKIEFQFNK